MIVVEAEIHGYLRGHQLLSTSVGLAKGDQAVIDRLSDVAGPLRPNERFEPYLCGYPLPGGDRYVLARTWQDLTVARAGCVRTLSLVIPEAAWAGAGSLKPFIELLDPSAFPEAAKAEARRVKLTNVVLPMPPVRAFWAGEFVEALFLEETKPIVVFGAPEAELVVLRLLTAMWTDLRRRFAFSTFARSPRRIEGRPFDLVFAPKDARPKFADWPGRRIDGTADGPARHRWTGDIVGRVFTAAVPRLLTERDVALAGPHDSATAAPLRISLLWAELIGKIETTPTAALGLLDIADSRGVWNDDTLEALDAAIAVAVRSTIAAMPPDQAWEFVTALFRKMRGLELRKGRSAMLDAVVRLAGPCPGGAVSFLARAFTQGIRPELASAVADGMARAPDDLLSSAVMPSASDVLGRIAAASDAMAARIACSPALLHRLADALPDLEPGLTDEVRDRLLPMLAEEYQVPIAGQFIGTLDSDGLMDEVRHLHAANDLAVPGFAAPIVARARELDVIEWLRQHLLDLPRGDGRDQTLLSTITAAPADLAWLLGAGRVPAPLVAAWCGEILRTATPSELAAIAADDELRDHLIAVLPPRAVDARLRLLTHGDLPLDVHTTLLLDLLPELEPVESADRIREALSRCLRTQFEHDEAQVVIRLLDAAGDGLDAVWVLRHGLGQATPASVASRNLVAFDAASVAARSRILASVEVLASALEARRVIDIDRIAIGAAANLLGDAMRLSWSTAVAASGCLLPLLMRSTRDPVSPLVAVAFPAVYGELAKAEEVPDIFKFVPFVDWDRCKSARRELVFAFLSSSAWAPADLALTSYRCGDIEKIFRRVAKSYDGPAYLNRIWSALEELPAECRGAVEQSIAIVRSGRTNSYDWRD